MRSGAPSSGDAPDWLSEIITELTAANRDRRRYDDLLGSVLRGHDERLGRPLALSLRASAEGCDSAGNEEGGTLLLVAAGVLEDMLDYTGWEEPTPDHCRFLHRRLLSFGNTDTEESREAAKAAFLAELGAYSEFTGSAMPNALRAVVRARSGRKFQPHPGLGRTLLTLGGAALLHVLRQGSRAWLARAFTGLGTALLAYPGGDRSAVRETALVSCRAGCAMLLPDAPARERAHALNLVATALFARETGDRDENRRDAARYVRSALRLLESDPRLRLDWAFTQVRLAGVLHELVGDDHRMHQEEALAALRRGLEVLDEAMSRGDAVVEWARAHMLLGMVLIERIDGDRRENLAEARHALFRANDVWQAREMTEEAAHTLGAWSATFFDAEGAESAADLRTAIEAFGLVLEQVPVETHAPEHAMTMSNLGLAWMRLAGHLEGADRRAAMEMAVDALRTAVELLADTTLSYWTAVVRMNLAGAYLALASDAVCQEVPDAVQRAFVHIGESGRVFTRESYPRQWGLLRQLLGRAHLRQVSAGRAGADDEDNGFAALEEAQSVLTPHAFPHDALMVGRELGAAAAARGRWEDAARGYARAADAIDQLRRQSAVEPRRDEIVASAADVYAGLVRSLLHSGRPAEAFAAAERSKARELSELLAEQQLRPSVSVPAALVEALDRARATQLSAAKTLRAAAVRRALRGEATENAADAPLAGHLAAVEAAQAIVERALVAIQAFDPAFVLAQSESAPPVPDELGALLADDRTALVSMYAADQVYVFVQTRSGVNAEVASASEIETLEQALVAYAEEFDASDYGDVWWLDGHLHAAGKGLRALCRALGSLPAGVDRLLLVPHRYLHLLPLHAVEVGGTPLIDRFPGGVAYAPSARLLALAQGRGRRAFDRLLAVEAMGVPPLPAVELEVEMVAGRFPRALVIRGAQATQAVVAEGLSGAHALHFACHGDFNRENPLASALLLADEEPLTLAEVFALNLSRCRLTVLSACRTGLVGVGRTEEYVGLPAGFLYAGSAAVVSSLWSVDDVSTALLSARMYDRLHETGDPCAPYAVAEALSFAQRWLRDSTSEDLQRWLLARRRGVEADAIIQHALESLRMYRSDERPFDRPYYWAAFIATGC